MNNETEKQTNAPTGQAPPEAAQEPAEQPAENNSAQQQPAQENTEQPPQEEKKLSAGESPAPEQPAQDEKTQYADAPAAPQPPAPIKRRQHYFTNLPTIGLEAEPLTAPWENDNPQEESSDDYDYPDGYKPAPSDKKAMMIAVAAASVIAVAVLAFIAYILLFTIDYGKPAVVATAPSASRTNGTVAVMEETTDPNMNKIVVMPNLNGLKESEAYKRLNAAEVRYRVERVNDNEVPFNYIVSQYPQPGTEFPRSQEAIVYLSKGKENEIIESPSRAKTSKSTQPTTVAGSTSATGATAATGTTGAPSADYILPESASRQLTRSEITGLSREMLNLALNEIYARHGRKFEDASISAYFAGKSWYHPTIAANAFDEGILNQFELYNLRLISNYQSEMGYR